MSYVMFERYNINFSIHASSMSVYPPQCHHQVIKIIICLMLMTKYKTLSLLFSHIPYSPGPFVTIFHSSIPQMPSDFSSFPHHLTAPPSYTLLPSSALQIFNQPPFPLSPCSGLKITMYLITQTHRIHAYACTGPPLCFQIIHFQDDIWVWISCFS